MYVSTSSHLTGNKSWFTLHSLSSKSGWIDQQTRDWDRRRGLTEGVPKMSQVLKAKGFLRQGWRQRRRISMSGTSWISWTSSHVLAPRRSFTKRCTNQLDHFSTGAPHNVKSDLIWRTYSPRWLYKAIVIKWGDLRRAGNFGRCLLGTYWGTPDGWHTLTQTNTNTFQYWALLAVKWWPLLPKYGHKSYKINGIVLFFTTEPLHLFPSTQESIKPSKILTSHFSGKQG